MDTLSAVSPLFIATAAVMLLGVFALFAASRTVRSTPLRTALRLTAAFLLLRLILVGNPWAWQVYAGLLSPYGVGWRQYDAVLLARESFMRRPEPVRYLAVGSSQTAVIYGGLARDRTDVGILAVAAMQPLDFTLYRSHIARHRPERILLYLSDFDIARRPSPEALLLAPPQRQQLATLAAQMSQLPDAHAYSTTFAGILIGELFPEYRYRFVFRGLVDRGAQRIASIVGRSSERPPRATSEEMIAWARQSFAPDYIGLNLRVLRDFLHWAARHDIEVVIVEGHYNPAVLTPDIEKASQTVRAELEQLGDSVEGVTWIPRTAVMEFTASDYTDLSHVTPEAGYAFASHVIDVLERNALGRRASLRR